LLEKGSFSFSVMFLLVKLMQGTANSFTLVFYRSLVQIAISLGAIIKNRENPLGGQPEDDLVSTIKTRLWLLVRGGFGACAVIAWFFGIQNLPLPDAVTLQFTTPPFAAAFAVVMVGEHWLRLDMIGAVVCLAGVALIAHPTWLFPTHHENVVELEEDPIQKAMAVAVTTAGAAMAGIAYVSVRLIGNRASANVMVLYYAVMSIPIVLFGSHSLLGKWSVWGSAGQFSVLDYCLLLLTGLAGYGGQLFTNIGLQRETAATVSYFKRYCCILYTRILLLFSLYNIVVTMDGWNETGYPSDLNTDCMDLYL
jgi:drug/metabolite transporter (DMT)-like permease